MIQCPWCSKQVRLYHSTCPECLHEVLPEHLDSTEFIEEDNSRKDNSSSYHHELGELEVEELLMNRFRCSKCKHDECNVKEVAMTGTGLSKMFDIQHHHILLVSCQNCGSIEMYDPDVLRGTKSGKLGTIMDILFGG